MICFDICVAISHCAMHFPASIASQQQENVIYVSQFPASSSSSNAMKSDAPARNDVEIASSLIGGFFSTGANAQ